jgi:hypothetical protein
VAAEHLVPGCAGGEELVLGLHRLGSMLWWLFSAIFPNVKNLCIAFPLKLFPPILFVPKYLAKYFFVLKYICVEIQCHIDPFILIFNIYVFVCRNVI